MYYDPLIRNTTECTGTAHCPHCTSLDVYSTGATFLNLITHWSRASECFEGEAVDAINQRLFVGAWGWLRRTAGIHSVLTWCIPPMIDPSCYQARPSVDRLLGLNHLNLSHRIHAPVARVSVSLNDCPNLVHALALVVSELNETSDVVGGLSADSIMYSGTGVLLPSPGHYPPFGSGSLYYHEQDPTLYSLACAFWEACVKQFIKPDYVLQVREVLNVEMNRMRILPWIIIRMLIRPQQLTLADLVSLTLPWLAC